MTAAAHRARGAGLRFQPLGAEYFAPSPRPRLRAAAGLLAAPLLLAVILAALAGVIAFFEQAPDTASIDYAADTFAVMAAAFYGPVCAPALAAFLILWSLRLRSRGAFAAAALVSGGVGVGISALQLGAASGATALAVVGLHLALLLLARRLAGVRGPA